VINTRQYNYTNTVYWCTVYRYETEIFKRAASTCCSSTLGRNPKGRL